MPAGDHPSGRRASARPRWYSHPYNRAVFYRLVAVTGWLPRPARLAAARRLGRLAARLFPAERAAARKTLAVVTGATGPRLEELTRDVFRDFAMCFSDLVSTNRQPAARLVAQAGPVTGEERLAGVDGGVISLTAHVGNWELAGRLLAGRSGRRTHVVVDPDEARELERWVRRNGDGVRFVPRAHPAIAVELLGSLRRREVIALQGDRALGNDGDVRVDFFGRPAPFPIGPFRLARAARVPIVPAFCLLDADHRYTVTVMEPLRVAPGEEEEGLRAWVSVLESVVRQHPTQWFNFFDAWTPFPQVEPGTMTPRAGTSPPL
jgi:Kdo2-lipid IVA lauroyltransferase/acyltransferase